MIVKIGIDWIQRADLTGAPWQASTRVEFDVGEPRVYETLCGGIGPGMDAGEFAFIAGVLREYLERHA